MLARFPGLVNKNGRAGQIQGMDGSDGERVHPVLSEPDREFLTAFHNRTLNRFSHIDHLKLAWIVMRAHDLGSGLNVIREGIRGFAIDQNARNRYHETLTMFWGRIVHHAVQTRPEIQDFDQFVASFPLLLDKDLPLRHWNSETLWSHQARETWLVPDLSALPD